MSSTDTDYYRARAVEEREQALAADRKNVAELHLEIARLYDALVSEPELRPALKIVPPFTRLSAYSSQLASASLPSAVRLRPFSNVR